MKIFPKDFERIINLDTHSPNLKNSCCSSIVNFLFFNRKYDVLNKVSSQSKIIILLFVFLELLFDCE